jgi:ATP-binding cassette subfamily B protein
MIVSAMAEVISIGALLPFLQVIINPDLASKYHFFDSFLSFLNINAKENLIFLLLILFAISVIFAGAIKLSLAYCVTKYSFLTGSEFSAKCYSNVINQNYENLIQKNSSDLINTIFNKSNEIIYNIILPSLTLISSFFMAIFILLMLIYIDAVVAISIISVLASVYTIIFLLSKQQIKRGSEIASIQSTQNIKLIQESIGTIRDIIIDNSHEIYVKNFQQINSSFRRSQALISFIGASPKVIIETISLLTILLAILLIDRSGGEILQFLPVFGVLALGAQKLMPMLQQVYASWVSISGGQLPLEDVLQVLEMEARSIAKSKQDIIFNKKIEIQNLSYKYPNSKEWVLKIVNLEVPKGSRVGVVGRTGSGKSTLIDLIMGLLTPSQGVMKVDGVSIDHLLLTAWQSHIAHVPQDIFLMDGTIAENVALTYNISGIDEHRLRDALKKSQLLDYVNNLPNGFNARVGERGQWLSGGQRQRIGIARALYKGADVIVFDEATSALDEKTESEIIDEISAMNNQVTIFMIAHRVETLNRCNLIIEVDANLKAIKMLSRS